MKHILMIATGGTIACCETVHGLSPALDSAALLAAEEPLYSVPVLGDFHYDRLELHDEAFIREKYPDRNFIIAVIYLQIHFFIKNFHITPKISI